MPTPAWQPTDLAANERQLNNDILAAAAAGGQRLRQMPDPDNPGCVIYILADLGGDFDHGTDVTVEVGDLKRRRLLTADDEGHVVLRLKDANHAPAPAPAAASGGGGVTVPVVEITSPASLLKALEAKADRHAATADAASDALSRAGDEVSAVAAMVAQCKRHQLPEDHIRLVEALRQPAGDARDAAETAASAAYTALHAAQAAVDTAAAHVSFVGRAAGGFYQGRR